MIQFILFVVIVALPMAIIPSISHAMNKFTDKEICMGALTKINQWSKKPTGGESKQGRYVKNEGNKYYFKSSSNNWKCTIKGKKVMWGLKDGRWRNAQEDGIINFNIVGNKLTITEIFSDGSIDNMSYTKNDIIRMF